MISTQTNNNQFAIVHLYNLFVNLIDNTFLSIFPEVIKKIVSLTLISLMAYLFIIALCLIIGILYHFTIAMFNTNQDAITNRFKLSIFFVINKIKHPHEDGYWITTVYKFLPFITIVGFFTPFWLVSLPLLPIVIFSNKYISNKLNIKINLWFSTFFIMMAFILFQLLEYSSQI